MLAALVVIAGTQAQQPDQTKAWLDLLLKVAKTEHASFCVDVDELAFPAPFQYPKRDGYRGLDRLATAINRTRTTIDGVSVFRRRLDEDDLRLQNAHEHVIAVLNSLSVTETNKLRQGDLYLSSLPSMVQRRLRHAIALLGDGLGDSMLAEYPDRIGMRLVLDPVAVFSSRTGDGNVTLQLLDEKTKVPVPESGGGEPAPLGRPADGEVDFGDGEIATLREICAKAERVLQKTFWYDGRLAPTRYFISGTFTEKRLLDVIAAVTEPFPVTQVPEGHNRTEFAAERQRLVAIAFGPYSDDKVGVAEVTIGDLIAGKSTTVKELFGSDIPQKLKAFMAQYRIQPEDRAEVSGELYLAIAAPGMATLYGASIDGLGNPVPYSLPHFIKIGF